MWRSPHFSQPLALAPTLALTLTRSASARVSRCAALATHPRAAPCYPPLAPWTPAHCLCAAPTAGACYGLLFERRLLFSSRSLVHVYSIPCLFYPMSILFEPGRGPRAVLCCRRAWHARSGPPRRSVARVALVPRTRCVPGRVTHVTKKHVEKSHRRCIAFRNQTCLSDSYPALLHVSPY